MDDTTRQILTCIFAAHALGILIWFGVTGGF